MSIKISNSLAFIKFLFADSIASSNDVFSDVICVLSSTIISPMDSLHLFSINEESSLTLYWQQSSTSHTPR